MDCKCIFLGILLAGTVCLGAEYITVNNDVKVKPSEPGHLVDVTLNCTGSSSDLAFYIKNRLNWDFIRKTDGRKFALTQSFYHALGSEYAAEHFGSGHLEFRYSPDAGTKRFVFQLSVKGVTHADNGVYRCFLLNEFDNIVDWKDVNLTVVNPVESLSLKLYNITHSVLVQSSSPITEGDNILEVKPGQYMVTCDAFGSNPEPIMSLYYNDYKFNVTVDVNEKPEGDRMHYTGSFHMDSITLQASSSPQELTCTANIQGSFFPNKAAGISLLVQLGDKPSSITGSGDGNIEVSHPECITVESLEQVSADDTCTDDEPKTGTTTGVKSTSKCHTKSKRRSITQDMVLEAQYHYFMAQTALAEKQAILAEVQTAYYRKALEKGPIVPNYEHEL